MPVRTVREPQNCLDSHRNKTCVGAFALQTAHLRSTTRKYLDQLQRLGKGAAVSNGTLQDKLCHLESVNRNWDKTAGSRDFNAMCPVELEFKQIYLRSKNMINAFPLL